MPLSKTIISDVQQQISGIAKGVYHDSAPYLIVSVSYQCLYLLVGYEVLAYYPISTGLKGAGNQEGSGQTPLGLHRIAEKIGANASIGSIFKARCHTGGIAPILTTNNKYSDADYITSRILWLDGLELGKNKGGCVDSYRRYIYIHGTDEEWRLGNAVSHGCIRMANEDVIQLFNEIVVDSLVAIIK